MPGSSQFSGQNTATNNRPNHHCGTQNGERFAEFSPFTAVNLCGRRIIASLKATAEWAFIAGAPTGIQRAPRRDFKL